MFGDILSDEASMVTGSIGMLSSASLNETNLVCMSQVMVLHLILQARIRPNPIATILSAAMMLRFSLDLDEEADAVEAVAEGSD